MIAEFLDSWALFQTTYLVGWLSAFTLALVGVWVVARDQIFLGAAVSQASTLGIAGALRLAALPAGAGLAWLGSEWFAGALAVLASVLTALLTTRPPRPGRESPDAVTGWVFLLGASVPVLLVAHSAHGLEEVHRVVFSTVLGATAADLWAFAGLGGAAAIAAAALRPRLLLLAMDPELAEASGLRERRWRIGLALVLGVAVGLAIRATGMLYTFGCLVLPALVAKNLCREVAPVFWLAPLVAVLAGVTSFVLAHHFDLPPAQTTVALLCAALLAAWGVRALRRARA